MLYYKTIDESTLELLKKLQKKEVFSDLRLVGGTALALQIGHRKSIDLDLFGNIGLDEFAITKELKDLGEIITLKKTNNIFIYSINNIKVDIVNYPYPWIRDPLRENGILLSDIKDIAAMKLAAITGRGTKKDFIDIYFLLHKYSLKQLFEFYSEKYFDGSVFLVLKSLSYFADADLDEDPLMFDDIEWDDIKNYLKIKLDNYAENEI